MMKRRLNWKPDLPDKRDYQFRKIAGPRDTPFQPLCDLRPQMSPVVDQGELGSCTANAHAAAREFLQVKENKIQGLNNDEFVDGQFFPVSRLYIYYNERVLEGDPGQDNGAQIRTGIKAMSQWGICRESVWPYNLSYAFSRPNQLAFKEGKAHLKYQGFRLDNTNLTELKHCLVSGYPFVFGISVYDSFMSVGSDGMVPMPDVSVETVQGGHAICCAGYDDSKQAFIVKNSWGTSWGDQGYCYIPYDYLTDGDLASDFWMLKEIPN